MTTSHRKVGRDLREMSLAMFEGTKDPKKRRKYRRGYQVLNPFSPKNPFQKVGAGIYDFFNPPKRGGSKRG